MIKRLEIWFAISVAGLACAGIAGAQQLDVRTLTKPKVEAMSCTEIVWEKELIERYPRIADACQEVVLSNGVKFARFTGQLERVNRDGSVRIDFKDRAGSSLGRLTLQPAPSQRVLIEGKEYKFSELDSRQDLSLYIPERLFAIATAPGTPPEAMARIVPDEPAVAERELPVQAAVQVAVAERLPDTAGLTPVLALGGILAMLGGLALTARRRWGAPRNS
jgi:hypothetical protein